MGNTWPIVKLHRKFFFVTCFFFGLLKYSGLIFFSLRVSSFVSSAEGEKTQKRVWAELSEKLERIQPGILQNI